MIFAVGCRFDFLNDVVRNMRENREQYDGQENSRIDGKDDRV